MGGAAGLRERGLPTIRSGLCFFFFEVEVESDSGADHPSGLLSPSRERVDRMVGLMPRHHQGIRSKCHF